MVITQSSAQTMSSEVKSTQKSSSSQKDIVLRQYFGERESHLYEYLSKSL